MGGGATLLLQLHHSEKNPQQLMGQTNFNIWEGRIP